VSPTALDFIRSSFYVELGELNDYREWIRGGNLRWAREGGVGPSSHVYGDLVGSIGKGGYRSVKIRIDGVKTTLKCHRIVMMLSSGFDLSSDLIIDHINGDKLNNDPRNLRIATIKSNCRNKQSARLDSNSKLLGVSYIKSTGKWRARLQCTIDGTGRHIGVFSSASLACEAYWNAKIVLEREMEQHWRIVMEKQLKIAQTMDMENKNVH
jgi:hypothetical protein